jgi:hypothetical protein
MKRVNPVPALIALTLLPAAGFAQQENSAAKQNRTQTTAGEPAENVTTALASRSAGFQPGFYADPRLAFGQGAKSAPQKPKPDKNKPYEIKRPPIEGSMVGYIDNAIVGSQIRIRFDAAFDDNSPDRAEFFYAKCGCYRALNGTPFAAAFDPNAPGPGTGIPTALNYQQLRFNGEYAPYRRLSLFVDVPFRWLQPQGFVSPSNLPFTPSNFGNQGGISDVEAGFKAAAIANQHTYLTFQLRTYFPSGDSFKGLGTAHYSVEPAILLYQKLSNRAALEAQLSDWHPIGGSAGVPVSISEGFAGDIVTYGLGLSYRFQVSERVTIAPVVEMVGWNVTNGFQSLQPGFKEISGTNIVNIKGGFRTSFDHHNSFYIGFGQAATHDLWYKHLVRFEYRYRF